jgi:hypothetical protein
LGVSGFYVKSEPSYFEFISLIAIILNIRKLHPHDILCLIFCFFLLNISTLFSYNFIKSLFYNCVTTFLLSIGFLFFRLRAVAFRPFLTGSVIGLISTLIISLFIPELIDAWFYSRLMGGFKDPNVLAPSVLFVLIMINESTYLRVKNHKIKWAINIMGVAMIFAAQSRIALFSLIIYISFRFKKYMLYSLPVIIFCISYYKSYLYGLYEQFFGNRSDSRRFSGQLEAIEMSTILGNGATSSDYLVGHPPHNSFIRIISDNGVLVSMILVCILLIMTYLNFKKINFNLIIYIGLTFLFSLVIDTLHWRHIYIYIAFVLLIFPNDIRFRTKRFATYEFGQNIGK